MERSRSPFDLLSYPHIKLTIEWLTQRCYQAGTYLLIIKLQASLGAPVQMKQCSKGVRKRVAGEGGSHTSGHHFLREPMVATALGFTGPRPGKQGKILPTA